MDIFTKHFPHPRQKEWLEEEAGAQGVCRKTVSPSNVRHCTNKVLQTTRAEQDENNRYAKVDKGKSMRP